MRRRSFPARCGVVCLRRMNDDDLTIIGEHYGLGRAASSVFGITRADRRQGLHLIGQSGTGKSSLMLDMLCQDIDRGDGVTLIDPHGLLAEKLLDHIPPNRIEDVCYFNVADAERPIPFNILETNLPPEKQHLAVSAVVAAFSGIWKLTPERAPRLLNILKYGVAALLETPDATLLSLERLLTDEAYRVRVVTRHSNDAVRRYWLETFDKKDAALPRRGDRSGADPRLGFRHRAPDAAHRRATPERLRPARHHGRAQNPDRQPRHRADRRGERAAFGRAPHHQTGACGARPIGQPGRSLPRPLPLRRRVSPLPERAVGQHPLGHPRVRLGAHACAPVRGAADRTRREARSSAASARRSPSAPAKPTPRSSPSTTAATSPSSSSPASTTARSTCACSWAARQEIFQGRTLPFDAPRYDLKTAIIERSSVHFGSSLAHFAPIHRAHGKCDCGRSRSS